MRVKARTAKRVADMKAVQVALEMYYYKNKAYPSTTGAWRGQCSAYGGYTANNVIPGLAPIYIDVIPSDPTMAPSATQSCYQYKSDGNDYAFRDKDITVTDPSFTYVSQSSLLDPTNDGGGNGCVLDGTNYTAWKVSSAGGTCW
jgi:hypothetical protein